MASPINLELCVSIELLCNSICNKAIVLVLLSSFHCSQFAEKKEINSLQRTSACERTTKSIEIGGRNT